jgi:hypothetical protein
MERDWVSLPVSVPNKTDLFLKKPYNMYTCIELYFRQLVMSVAFGYGKLHQAMFGDQLEVWVWSKLKKRLSSQNKKMSRWNPRVLKKNILSHDLLGKQWPLDVFQRAQEKVRRVFRTIRYVKYKCFLKIKKQSNPREEGSLR